MGQLSKTRSSELTDCWLLVHHTVNRHVETECVLYDAFVFRLQHVVEHRWWVADKPTWQAEVHVVCAWHSDTSRCERRRCYPISSSQGESDVMFRRCGIILYITVCTLDVWLPMKCSLCSLGIASPVSPWNLKTENLKATKVIKLVFVKMSVE